MFRCLCFSLQYECKDFYLSIYLYSSNKRQFKCNWTFSRTGQLSTNPPNLNHFIYNRPKSTDTMYKTKFTFRLYCVP